MSSTHGGAREGAGRPRKTTFDQEPQTGYEQEHPVSWLWKELERRFGKEVADDIHLAFNEQSQRYQKSLIAKERQRRQQERERVDAIMREREQQSE